METGSARTVRTVGNENRRHPQPGVVARLGASRDQCGPPHPFRRRRGRRPWRAAVVLEQSVAEAFRPYYDLVDLGYSYRYYAEPPPTPVVTATLEFGGGRPDETVRLPGLNVAGPRMRHQRQLALANSLSMAVRETKERTGDSAKSSLARRLRRHLCTIRPECRSVTLRVQYHLIPEMEQVREATQSPGDGPFDLFADSLFTTPEWIGDYACDGF